MTTQELFRFAVPRRAERFLNHRHRERFVSDGRSNDSDSVLATVLSDRSFPSRLEDAETFARTNWFVLADDPRIIDLDQAAELLRAQLTSGIALPDLVSQLMQSVGSYAAMLNPEPTDNLLGVINQLLERLWDSLYVEVVRSSAIFTSTNYLADAIRSLHVAGLIREQLAASLPRWRGAAFDDYELFIDHRSIEPAPASTTIPPPGSSNPPGTIPTTRPGQDDTSMIDGIATAEEALGAARVGDAHVPLLVGEVRPPIVGDLYLVEEDLRCYELGEIANIENVMARERKERTMRTLSRTVETSSITSESEREESQSRTVDERFSMSSEAQKSADQALEIDAGVSASGSFGPVKVSATLNASYSTSKSQSESTAQELARNVTEEASQRVREAVIQTSSVTVLNEEQQSSLHGVNNEESDQHVVGIYRWIDKIYEARTMNYGRRLMLDISIPEPAAFFRGVMTGDELETLSDLEEPLHPSKINRSTLDPLTPTSTSGFESFLHIEEATYAQLAARYDVTDVGPPPLETVVGSKTVVYPEGDIATPLEDENDKNELTYVYGDTSLAVDADYRLEKVGVFAPKGSSGGFGNYANTLGIQSGSKGRNQLNVLIGEQSFFLEVPEDGQIESNFNEYQDVADWDQFAGGVTPAIPITFSADFEGKVHFTVIYSARLRDGALDRWRRDTYEAILQGYERKKREYDDALDQAEASIEAEMNSRTYQLRDEQYRQIELTEIKRGTINVLTEGTATGQTSISVDSSGLVTTHFTDPTIPANWRSPLANGAVATFFEQAFEWENVTYTFHPYFWTDNSRWQELINIGGGDPVFEAFLKAGQASTIVPVRPGYERAVVYFLKTGLLWYGGYLPLFNDIDMLEVHADAENATVIDPPEQVGEPWDITLPTSLVMLQSDAVLPKFPAAEDEPDSEDAPIELVADTTAQRPTTLNATAV